MQVKLGKSAMTKTPSKNFQKLSLLNSNHKIIIKFFHFVFLIYAFFVPVVEFVVIEYANKSVGASNSNCSLKILRIRPKFKIIKIFPLCARKFVCVAVIALCLLLKEHQYQKSTISLIGDIFLHSATRNYIEIMQNQHPPNKMNFCCNTVSCLYRFFKFIIRFLATFK